MTKRTVSRCVNRKPTGSTRRRQLLYRLQSRRGGDLIKLILGLARRL